MKNWLLRYYPLFPGLGLILYLVVFAAAANMYPGGSENVPFDSGFSFFHNFLCDVMNPVTHGGFDNPARPLATISHFILSLSMIGFFYILPDIFAWTNRNTRLVRYAGVFTMTVFIFMYTEYHDQIVTATGLFGTVALFPFFVEMRKYPGGALKRLAYLCFLMSIVVFFIFETRFGFYYLPFIQKFVFIIDASWVMWVGFLVYQKNEQTQRGEMTSLSRSKPEPKTVGDRITEDQDAYAY